MRSALFVSILIFFFVLCLPYAALTQQQIKPKKSIVVSEESDIDKNEVAASDDVKVRNEGVRIGIEKRPSGEKLNPSAVPTTMNYQGLLEDESGPASGTKSMIFSLYDTEAGGTALWTETQSVDVGDNGLFSVTLGEVTPIDGLDFTETYYLEVGVEGETMTPREALSSVGYAKMADAAIIASNSDLLDGMDSSDFAEADHSHDGRYYTETELNTSDGSGPNTGANRVHWDILTGMPAGFADGVDNTGGDGDITGVIAGNGLTGGGMSGDVTLGIAANGVGSNEIATGAVGADEIATNGVGSAEIATNAVGSDEIAAGAVGSSEIATDAVGPSEVAANAIDEDEIEDGSVGSAEIGPNAVGNSELQDYIDIPFLTSNDINVTGTSGNAINVTSSGSSLNAAIVSTHTNGGNAIWGNANDNDHYGVVGNNDYSSGTGIVGIGNNQSGATCIDGSGISGVGSKYGVFGEATASSGSRAGGFFFVAPATQARVAYITSTGTEYKIQGTGAVSSIMSTTAGDVALIAPESPEAWVQDFGTGRMINGRASVELDPTFVECATISAKYPMIVFVTFTSPPPNSYYVEKGADGFEVISTSGDNPNATFDYFVSLRWKGWEDIRFDPVDPPPEIIEWGSMEEGDHGMEGVTNPSIEWQISQPNSRSSQPRSFNEK